MKKMLTVAMLLVAPFTTAFADPGVENCAWPSVNHDLHNTRSSPCTTITFNDIKSGLLQEIWAITGGAVQAAPVVAGSAVYYTDDTGTIFKRDIGTGALLNSFVYPAGQTSSGPLTIANGVVYAVTSSTDPLPAGGIRLYALDLNLVPIPTFNFGNPVDVDPGFTGKEANVFAGPVVTKDKVIVATSNGVGHETLVLFPYYRGGFHTFNASTGAFIWRTRVSPLSSGYGPSGGTFSTGAVDEDLDYMFVGTSNATFPDASPLTDALLAIDTNNGEVIWHRQYQKNDVYSFQFACGPNLDNGASPNLFSIKSSCGKKRHKVVGCSSKKGIYRVFDRKNGEPVWHTSIIPKDAVPSIDGNAGAAYKDGYVYVPGIIDTSGIDYGAFSILVQYGLSFTVPDIAPLLQLLDYIRNYDYTYIKALNAEDGHVKWENIHVGCTLASLTEANGVIYTITHPAGEVRAINTKNGEEFEFANYNIASGAPITVVGDYVFIGTGLPGGGGTFHVFHKN